jgi:maltooligosyltrehalose trehalohydrolase
MEVGAKYRSQSCDFTVWAPKVSRVDLKLVKDNSLLGLKKAGNGYWRCNRESLDAGSEYLYELDGKTGLPDPASHFQPKGVFGPSAVVDHDRFVWQDSAYRGLQLRDMVFYELHVGTFTPKGTFQAVIDKLEYLKDLGVNALELMPITQFSGTRNWGYDTVFPFAVQNNYGTPDHLKELVNACHLRNLAVFIDVIYNHSGPEGSCLNQYAPYFVERQGGRWGPVINLDGENCGGVRHYFLQNALHWFRNYHVDGLRLDSILSMPDTTKPPFFSELTALAEEYSTVTGKKQWLVAESGYNQPKVLQPREEGGYGFDGQWLDDYHHAIHAVLTGEREGYYKYYGTLTHLKETLVHAYAHVGGDFAGTTFHRRKKNQHFFWIPSYRLIVFSQNHDHVGNRMLSERLTTLAGLEAAKLAAGIVVLSPYTPMLFMGEEFGESAPFNFFVDYADKNLSEATREGRKREFSSFHWKGESPDPSDPATFEATKIDWNLREKEANQKIFEYYKALLRLRSELSLSSFGDRQKILATASCHQKVLFVRRRLGDDKICVVVANFSKDSRTCRWQLEGSNYRKILDSADTAWNGCGASLLNDASVGDELVFGGFNLAVYLKEEG